MVNEKRLIDANALLENSDVFTMHTKEYGSIEVIPVEQIGDATTVDAVEVVRCKDCKHFSEDQYGCVCNLHSEKETEDYPAFEVQVLPIDFCSYGERKDND